MKVFEFIGDEHEQSDLAAHVVDVVVHFEVILLETEQAGKAVAYHGISRPAHVGAGVGVDAGMLEHGALSGPGGIRPETVFLAQHRLDNLASEERAVELEIQIRPGSGARKDFRPEGGLFDGLGRQLVRSSFELARGQEKGYGHVSKSQVWRCGEGKVLRPNSRKGLQKRRN